MENKTPPYATAPQFWMVYGLSRGSPNKRHNLFAEADAEAMRLARQHPGERFIVLEAITGHVVDIPATTRLSLTPP